MISTQSEFHSIDPLKILSQRLVVNDALTADDIVNKLINKKIHDWFLSKYGAGIGQDLYDTYTEKVPPPLLWRKKRIVKPIPESFWGKQERPNSIGRDLPLQSDDKHFHLMRLHLTENNDGSYELQSYFEPLNRGKFVNQSWISAYRKQHEHKDGDVLLRGRKYAMNLAVGKRNLPLPMMDPPQLSSPIPPVPHPPIEKTEILGTHYSSPSKSLWTRLIATIMKIARCVLHLLRRAWNFIFHSNRVKENYASEDSRPLLKNDAHVSSKDNVIIEDSDPLFTKPGAEDPLIPEQIVFEESGSSESEDDYLDYF